MCRMRRVSSIDGSGYSNTIDVFMQATFPGSSVVAEERRASIEASDIWGCDPVSAVRRTRSDALWRAAPTFVDFRIAACIS